VAEVSFLVHSAGPQRDGRRRSEGGVEVCGARAGTRGEPAGPLSNLRTTPTPAGRSSVERSLAIRSAIRSAVDIEATSLDTAASALTGRHPPAAREHSHLLWTESCAFAPSFSLVSAGHRRFMKGGRRDRYEIPPCSSISRVPP
jgi:hypothetical protein